MMEITWGTPLTLVISEDGSIQKFTTIEQASYWLRRKWPVTDRHRDMAIDEVDAAMHCMTTVGSARRAFLAAAKTAGFALDITASEAAAAC